ncbi:hypothetical protein MKK84_31245 [Methylobacterium sp. E-065]|uniref:hypothetical protein n=1 Tax=Methylobacterium sp. E-065 TaxID=2836583 RepID=UPI001FBB6B4C|nr:hypothetical protein [Methylobacterium sp. E-065]MCJ2021837.1 hypothetical protein [Methylobacterium sp. E-065]
MSNAITRAELAEEAGKIGFATTGWIFEVMGPREGWNDPAPAETVAAFLAAFRERLDSIEARAGIAAPTSPRS